MKGDRLTQKHHNLVLDIVNKPPDVSNAEIYMKYYPKVKDIQIAAVNVSRLLRNAKIIELLSKLRSEAEERAISVSVATLLERKQVLTEIIRGRLSDVMDKNGNIDITGDTLRSAAIAEFKQTTGHSEKKDSDWETTSVKLRDPVPAIRELNLMEKVYDIPATTIQNIQPFIFVLPDGTSLSPAQLARGKTDNIIEGEIVNGDVQDVQGSEAAQEEGLP